MFKSVKIYILFSPNMSVSLILALKLLLGAKHTVKSLLLISVSISVRTREENLF